MKFLLILASVSTHTNAGDFLIRAGIEEQLKIANINYDKKFAEEITVPIINTYAGVIIGGGPQYSMRMFNNNVYNVNKIYKEIEVPIFFEGAGIYNETCLLEDILESKFSDEFISFYNYIQMQGGGYGCRDYITQKVLQKNGLHTGKMIGCPAWFDRDKLDSIEIAAHVSRNPKKIVISDPGLTKLEINHFSKAEQTIEVIKYIKDKFGDAKVLFTFNNGINTKYSFKCNNAIKEFLIDNEIDYYDMAGNANMFSTYDDADLHIGFRLHSHIYCLRKRIPSILIEEDARGYGFNDAVGLPHLTSYKKEMVHNGVFVKNEYLIDLLDYTIDKMYKTDCIELTSCFSVMKHVFYNERSEWMCKIKKLC